MTWNLDCGTWVSWSFFFTERQGSQSKFHGIKCKYLIYIYIYIYMDGWIDRKR